MTKSFAGYDRRGYRTLGIVEGYAAWAASYDETTDDRLDIALLSSLSSVDWKGFARAADLASGTGRIGCWLHKHGMHVDGVDISTAMLDHAALKSVYDSLHCAGVASAPGIAAAAVARSARCVAARNLVHAEQSLGPPRGIAAKRRLR